jgi:hypothetical protein
MGEVVTIPYKPRDWAREFHDSPKRWKVLICHRRAGKTVASVNHLIRDALLTPKSIYAYIAPSYKMAKRIAWEYVKEYTRPIPGMNLNESELRADFPNGSRIYLLGAESPDSLRGMALWGVVFDEASQQPPNIFSEIIRPALADNGGYAVWIGTLKGRNQLWTLYEKADDSWYRLLLRASESGVLNPAELADAKKGMSIEEFEQEFECSANAYIKGAYYKDELALARREGRIGKVRYDTTIKVDTSWDLGIGDSMAIWFYQQVGNEKHYIDYYENNGKALDFYIKVMQEKGYIYNLINLPHDARARELGTGKTREEIIQAIAPCSVNIVRNHRVEDGINAVRQAFNRYWFDEDMCAIGIGLLEQYQREWDDTKGVFRNQPLHNFASHCADSLRYSEMADSYGEYKAIDPQGLYNKYDLF